MLRNRETGLPVDIQLKLFDTMVMPILLYGSEVWGYENLDLLEQISFQVCKCNIETQTKHSQGDAIW